MIWVDIISFGDSLINSLAAIAMAANVPPPIAKTIVACALLSDRQNYVHCLATTHKLWQFLKKNLKNGEKIFQPIEFSVF
jgi:hypothetical protein